MKPKENEFMQKEDFLMNLKLKNKIDNYKIDVNPILLNLIKQYENRFPKLREYYKDSVHPETLEMLAHETNDHGHHGNGSDGFSSDSISDGKQLSEMVHTICKIEIEHYSYDAENKFLLVRTIEQLNWHSKLEEDE